jgi:hypothetical protein
MYITDTKTNQMQGWMASLRPPFRQWNGSSRRFFAPEPWIIGFGAMGFGTAVLVLEFQGNRTEKTGATFAHVSSQEEGSCL